MLPDAGALVGRENELNKLLSTIRERKSLHIYGPEGTGKSSLLNWAYDNWGEAEHSLVPGAADHSPGQHDSIIPVYSRDSSTFREIVLSISNFLLVHFERLKIIDKFKEVTEIRHVRDIKKLDIRALRNMIYAYLKQDKFCLMLDHLECVTPRINGFLGVLYEQLPVISASRQSWELTDYTFRGDLGHFLYLVPKLKVENLQKADALTLMKQIAGDARLDGDLLERVYCISNGNPGLIKKIISMALEPKYLIYGSVDLNLIMLDLEIEKIGKDAWKGKRP